jgi:hypothetical protein
MIAGTEYGCELRPRYSAAVVAQFLLPAASIPSCSRIIDSQNLRDLIALSSDVNVAHLSSSLPPGSLPCYASNGELA